ncbi:MAG: RNA polymerase sigma factor [Saprospiraceae bacterium]|nr:RNA polymerase sigma factor [Saprospiraceae bacterium]
MEINQVIEACISGDRKSQKELFELLSGKMMAVCMRYARHKMEAEDLLQDGFVKVFQNMKQYKFEGPFEQWVRKIMIHNAIKKYHRKSNKNELLVIDEIPEHGDDYNANNLLYYKELLNMVEELPDGYRMVFNLYAIEGYNHKEISEMMGIEESTSRSQLVKARKVLQDKLLKREKLEI